MILLLAPGLLDRPELGILHTVSLQEIVPLGACCLMRAYEFPLKQLGHALAALPCEEVHNKVVFKSTRCCSCIPLHAGGGAPLVLLKPPCRVSRDPNVHLVGRLVCYPVNPPNGWVYLGHGLSEGSEGGCFRSDDRIEIICCVTITLWH